MLVVIIDPNFIYFDERGILRQGVVNIAGPNLRSFVKFRLFVGGHIISLFHVSDAGTVYRHRILRHVIAYGLAVGILPGQPRHSPYPLAVFVRSNHHILYGLVFIVPDMDRDAVGAGLSAVFIVVPGLNSP